MWDDVYEIDELIKSNIPTSGNINEMIGILFNILLYDTYGNDLFTDIEDITNYPLD